MIQPPLTAELVLVLLATLMLIKLLLSWTDLGQWMDRSSAGQESPKDLLVTQSSNSFLRMICNLFVCLSISSVLEYFGPFFCLCMYVCIEKIHQYQPPHKATARRLMVNIYIFPNFSQLQCYGEHPYICFHFNFTRYYQIGL